MGRKVALLLNATEMLDTESTGEPCRVVVAAPHRRPGSATSASWCRSRSLGLIARLAGSIAAGSALRHARRLRGQRGDVLRVRALSLAARAHAAAVRVGRRSAGLPRLARAAPTPVAGRRRGSPCVAAAVFSNWPMLSKTLMRAITETNLAVALQAREHRRGGRALPPRDRICSRTTRPRTTTSGCCSAPTGQVDEAIATYQQALALKGDYPDAHYNLANALLEKNRPREAAEHFRIALRSIPDSAGAANNLGIALAAEDKPQDAVAAFRAAVAADPNAAVAHRNLADALASAGQIPRRSRSSSAPSRSTRRTPPRTTTSASCCCRRADARRRSRRCAPPWRSRRSRWTRTTTWASRSGSSGDLEGAIDQFRQALAIDANVRRRATQSRDGRTGAAANAGLHGGERHERVTAGSTRPPHGAPCAAVEQRAGLWLAALIVGRRPAGIRQRARAPAGVR